MELNIHVAQDSEAEVGNLAKAVDTAGPALPTQRELTYQQQSLWSAVVPGTLFHKLKKNKIK